MLFGEFTKFYILFQLPYFNIYGFLRISDKQKFASFVACKCDESQMTVDIVFIDVYLLIITLYPVFLYARCPEVLLMNVTLMEVFKFR